jgi:hypothetical protein
MCLRISMATTETLDEDLLAVKRVHKVTSDAMNLTAWQSHGFGMVVAFENANIELDMFAMERPFADMQVLLQQIKHHYTHEFVRQAFKVVGLSAI